MLPSCSNINYFSMTIVSIILLVSKLQAEVSNRSNNETKKEQVMAKEKDIRPSSENALPASKFDQELINAAVSKDISLVKDALNKGANVNAVTTEGISALHIAVNVNSEAIAKFLLDSGADVNIKDINGYTPLDYAKSAHFSGMIKLLNNYGAIGKL